MVTNPLTSRPRSLPPVLAAPWQVAHIGNGANRSDGLKENRHPVLATPVAHFEVSANNMYAPSTLAAGLLRLCLPGNQPITKAPDPCLHKPRVRRFGFRSARRFDDCSGGQHVDLV